MILFLSSSSGKISKAACYFVSFSQKAHLTLFNSISLDLIIYGVRTIFHGRNIDLVIKYSSGSLVTLMVLDYVEIWYLGSKTQLRTYEAKQLQLSQEDKAKESHNDQNVS